MHFTKSLIVLLLFSAISLTCYGKPLLTDHYYKVTASALLIRASSDAEAKVIGKLRRGDLIQVIGSSQEWAQINTDGSVGYVKSDFLEQAQPIPSDKSTFGLRFRHGFTSSIMVVLIGVSTIYGIRTRIKDSRFKTGYRLPKPGLDDAFIIGVLTVLVCSILGLVSAVAGLF